MKELKAAIREGVAAAVCRLQTALEYKKTPFGVISRPVPMLMTEPLDTIASMPPSSTPPLLSTGEPDAAAAPHSTAETASVIEPQSVSEIQPTNETHSIVEPPPLVATTLTTGTQSSTVVTLSIAAPTQTTETSPIVTQRSITVTSTIVVFSETADSRSVVTSVQSTTSSSSAVPVPATETVATVMSTSPRWLASAHRTETRKSKRAAMASAASEKKDTRQPVRSPTTPRSSKTARFAKFTYAGSYSSDSSPRPLRIESPPATESSTVIASEHEPRSVTPLLTSARSPQQPPIQRVSRRRNLVPRSVCLRGTRKTTR